MCEENTGSRNGLRTCFSELVKYINVVVVVTVEATALSTKAGVDAAANQVE